MPFGHHVSDRCVLRVSQVTQEQCRIDRGLDTWTDSENAMSEVEGDLVEDGRQAALRTMQVGSAAVADRFVQLAAPAPGERVLLCTKPLAEPLDGCVGNERVADGHG